jgi:hypothetical protein
MVQRGGHALQTTVLYSSTLTEQERSLTQRSEIVLSPLHTATAQAGIVYTRIFLTGSAGSVSRARACLGRQAVRERAARHTLRARRDFATTFGPWGSPFLGTRLQPGHPPHYGSCMRKAGSTGCPSLGRWRLRVPASAAPKTAHQNQNHDKQGQ